jgi:hypothetical protein
MQNWYEQMLHHSTLDLKDFGEGGQGRKLTDVSPMGK